MIVALTWLPAIDLTWLTATWWRTLTATVNQPIETEIVSVNKSMAAIETKCVE